jgi:AraC-like DNA-binding protein
VSSWGAGRYGAEVVKARVTRARRPPRTVPVALLAHLRRARDHIDRHYAQPLDLDRLAAVAGVSKYHFARSFEATYGETPMRYLTRRRIERAQDLLRVANLTVTEVCMVVGFASLGSFSTRFAQLVGESPTAYRDRWAARGGPHVPGCYLFMRGVLDPGATTGVLPPGGRPGLAASPGDATAQSSNMEEASAPRERLT